MKPVRQLIITGYLRSKMTIVRLIPYDMCPRIELHHEDHYVLKSSAHPYSSYPKSLIAIEPRLTSLCIPTPIKLTYHCPIENLNSSNKFM